MRQDNRRALRTGVHTVGAIWMLGLLTHIVLVAPKEKLVAIALGLLFILLLREVFHGVENSVARFKFTAGKDGVSGEAER